MKKLIIIVFENEEKYNFLSNQICEKFSDLSENVEFCGLWGEIQSNATEVLNSISDTVNHFIDSNKEKIIFGCCEKDYDKILQKLKISKCLVDKIDSSAVFK